MADKNGWGKWKVESWIPSKWLVNRKGWQAPQIESKIPSWNILMMPWKTQYATFFSYKWNCLCQHRLTGRGCLEYTLRGSPKSCLISAEKSFYEGKLSMPWEKEVDDETHTMYLPLLTEPLILLHPHFFVFLMTMGGVIQQPLWDQVLNFCKVCYYYIISGHSS